MLSLLLAAYAATFTVTNCNDTGQGSFRQAVQNSNNTGGTDTILFDYNIVACGSSGGLKSPVTITDSVYMTRANGTFASGIGMHGPGWFGSGYAGSHHMILIDGENITVDIDGNSAYPDSSPYAGLYFHGGYGVTNTYFGGVFRVYNGTLILHETYVGYSNCSSVNNGCALTLESGTEAIVSTTWFQKSKSQQGGLIYANNAELTLEDTVLTYGEATKDGGGIYAVESTVNLNRIVFKENEANDDGADVHLKLDKDSLFENVYFGRGIRYNCNVPFFLQSNTAGTGWTTILNSTFKQDAIFDCTVAGAIITLDGTSLIVANTLFGDDATCIYQGATNVTKSYEVERTASCGGVQRAIVSWCRRRDSWGGYVMFGDAPGVQIGGGNTDCDYKAACTEWRDKVPVIAQVPEDIPNATRSSLTTPGPWQERCEE